MEGPDSATNTSPRNHTSTRCIFGIRRDDREYVQFVHASLGFPAPTTFMNAVRKSFITGPHRYTRLTFKLVTKNMPHADSNLSVPYGDSTILKSSSPWNDLTRRLQNPSSLTKHSEVAPYIWILLSMSNSSGCQILSNRMLRSLYRYSTLKKPHSCADNKIIYSQRELLQKS